MLLLYSEVPVSIVHVYQLKTIGRSNYKLNIGRGNQITMKLITEEYYHFG